MNKRLEFENLNFKIFSRATRVILIVKASDDNYRKSFAKGFFRSHDVESVLKSPPPDSITPISGSYASHNIRTS